ncbi:MAG: c-type cytochrome [Campylobacterota bacterium]|nr:c-type cytochrome [Campylobacterota bacterium]
MKKILLVALATVTVLSAQSGETLVKENGCMECHNIMGKKLAPAFKGTARKNLKWYGNDAKLKIIDSIKNGSKGKYRNFADTEMPAYGHLADKDLDEISTWILDLYRNNRNMTPANRRGRPF